MSCDLPGPYADRFCNLLYRTSVTPTKSASTRSSRSGWPRWTSCALRRTVLEATRHLEMMNTKRCITQDTGQKMYINCKTGHYGPRLALGFFQTKLAVYRCMPVPSAAFFLTKYYRADPLQQPIGVRLLSGLLQLRMPLCFVEGALHLLA